MAVGDVLGSVVTQPDGTIVFQVIGKTGSLRRDQPFENKRLRLRIVEIAGAAASYVAATDSGSIVTRDALEGVTCKQAPTP